MTVRELINGLLNCNMDANIDVVLKILTKSVGEVIEEEEFLYLSNLQIDYIEDGNYPRIILEDVK
jgi:hypothetical protein